MAHLILVRCFNNEPLLDARAHSQHRRGKSPRAVAGASRATAIAGLKNGTCDLHKPQRDYDDVEDQIVSFGGAVRAEESVWLVDTYMSPVSCRDALRDICQQEATIFVIRLRRGWASFGTAEEVANWLRDPGRTWDE
jgi:hypothetical protein